MREEKGKIFRNIWCTEYFEESYLINKGALHIKKKEIREH